MTTHDPALQWAAERAGLPYDRFVAGLTAETIARIHAAYFRQNGSTIPQTGVGTAPTPDAVQPFVEAEQPISLNVKAEQAETALRAAFQANMHTLPPMVSAWRYKRFLEMLDVTTKAERKLLQSIVREEIRSATEPMANKLTHFLWWLDGQ